MARLSYRRKLPFLQRNWMRAIDAWQKPAQEAPKTAAIPIALGLHQRDEDQYGRPAKRRRCDDRTPATTIWADDSCGKLCLPEFPGELQKALRIEVLRVIHKCSSYVRNNAAYNGNVPPSVKDVVRSQARCRIIITSGSLNRQTLLFSDSQICELKTYKNPVGPAQMVKIYLPQPFLVPAEKIMVQRGENDDFGMAEGYQVNVELESIGGGTWPPLDFGDDGPLTPREGYPTQRPVLSAIMQDLYRVKRSRFPLFIGSGSRQGGMVRGTDHVVEIDVRWSTGFSDNLMRKRRDKEKFGLPTIHAYDSDDDKLPLGPADGNAHNGSSMHGAEGGQYDDVEEVEGDTTPTRSLRTRGTKNYNLKALSDRAQGREQRRRRKQIEKAEGSGEERRVTYQLPLPMEPFTAHDFTCCYCRVTTQTISQLRAHFRSHPNYTFEYTQRPGRNGNLIRVSHVPDAQVRAPPVRPPVYQLGKPTGLLDLDKYVDGDDSWVTSRYGPSNDGIIEHANQVPRKSIKRKSGKVVVPWIKQPLYDPLSKVLLEPGSEVRPHTADNAWLIQKHREIVQDYSDVSATEKEYIKEWDAFIIAKRISSDAYIARAFTAFVKERASWLLADSSRMEELGKHLTFLITKDVLNDGSINETLSLIAKARADPLPPPEADPKTSRESAPKSSGGCVICRLPVLGPSLLVCSNPSCEKPLHHDECAGIDTNAGDDVLDWLCDTCVYANL